MLPIWVHEADIDHRSQQLRMSGTLLNSEYDQECEIVVPLLPPSVTPATLTHSRPSFAQFYPGFHDDWVSKEDAYYSPVLSAPPVHDASERACHRPQRNTPYADLTIDVSGFYFHDRTHEERY